MKTPTVKTFFKDGLEDPQKDHQEKGIAEAELPISGLIPRLLNCIHTSKQYIRCIHIGTILSYTCEHFLVLHIKSFPV